MFITSTVEICIQQPGCVEEMFYHATQLCYRGVGSCNSVRLSARPHVRLLHACFLTNTKNLPAIFYTARKGNSSRQTMSGTAAKDAGGSNLRCLNRPINHFY